MKFMRKGTDSEGDDKDKEGSEWEKGDCSVLAPVASGTVDTGERVGVDRWGIAWLTTTTHLTLSIQFPTHSIVDEICRVDCDVEVEIMRSSSQASILTRSNNKLMSIGHAVAFLQG